MLDKKVRLIDLSRPIRSRMPVFPRAFQSFVGIYQGHKPIRSEEELSVMSGIIVMSDHGGTHVDATIHFNPRGKPSDQIPLELMMGPAIVQDFSHKKEHESVTARDIEKKFREMGISPDEVRIVLFRTGADPHYDTERYLNYYLEFEPEAIEWLIDRGIQVIGVDAITIDTYPSKRAHLLVRKREYYHIENLTNLDRVLGRKFLFIGFPLKVEGISGAPMRAVALLED